MKTKGYSIKLLLGGNLLRILALGLLVILICMAAAPSVVSRPRSGSSASPEPVVELPFPYSVSDSIRSYSQIDSYSFSLTYRREITIWLQTASIGSSLAGNIALYDANGKLMAYNDREFNLGSWRMTDDSILYLTLPEGKYTVTVTSAARFKNRGGIDSPTTGPYTLALFGKFDGPAIGDAYEPNDTVQAACPIALPFRTTTANLLYFGDIDWFKFNAKKGEKITIDIDTEERKSDPGLELAVKTRIGVFDETGRLLQSAATGTDPDTGFTGDPAMVFQAPGDGKYYVAVTAAPDTQYKTAFQDTQFLADPYVSSAAHLIGYYQLAVRKQQELFFPHIANGSFGAASFVTSMILLNSSRETATGEFKLYHASGSPLLTVFPGDGNPSSSYFFSIPPGRQVVVKTDGNGPGTTGYAIIKSNAPVGGTLVFSQFDNSGALVTEAAVDSSSPMDFFTFPVDVTGDYNTGFAVANLQGSSRANLFLRLQDSAGATKFTRNLSLDPGCQTAIFVGGKDQLFPSVAGFRGNLQVVSDVPVMSVALRVTSQTLTTLAPIPMNQPYQAVTLQFPHVVVGMGENFYRTTIILTNPGYFRVAGTLKFTRSDGTPMVVGIQSMNSATHNFTIPAQGTLFLETSPADIYSSGYATIDADHGLGGLVIYSQFERSSGRLQTEVAIPPASRHSHFAIFAQSEDGFNTGLALANLNSSPATLAYELLPGNGSANPQEKGPVDLGPGRQFAQLVAGSNQIFPAFAGQGTLRVTSSQQVFAIALRITATTMTALPVIPIP